MLIHPVSETFLLAIANVLEECQGLQLCCNGFTI